MKPANISRNRHAPQRRLAVPLLLCGPAALIWWFGFYLLWRLPRCRGSRTTASTRGCSIIIPARNEAHTLPRLLHSLRPQLGSRDEVLVVDDQSTDATTTVAATLGARVIDSGEPPPDWTGKTWACRRGALAAKNDSLVFVDADTWFAPDALGRMLATLRQRGGLVSVLPYHWMEKPLEYLSALFNLMVAIGVDAFSFDRARRSPTGAFGPCILCTKGDYFALGGHERVRGAVLEHLALGALFRQAGLPLACFGGLDTLYTRMYPGGMGALIEGWSKGLASGAGHTPPRTLWLVSTWLSGAFLAAISFVTAQTPRHPRTRMAVSVVYALYAGQLYWMLRRIGRFGPLTSVLFPLHLLFFVLLAVRSVLMMRPGSRVRWKGRSLTVRSYA